MEYIQTQVCVVKNGPQIHRLIYEVDTLKPKCWVDGYQYKFNSRLISREVFQNEEEYVRETRKHNSF